MSFNIKELIENKEKLNIKDEDITFYKHTQDLSELFIHYKEIAFFNILAKYTSFLIEIWEPEVQYVYVKRYQNVKSPYDIFLLNDKSSLTHPVERVMFDLFKDIPELKILFKDEPSHLFRNIIRDLLKEEYCELTFEEERPQNADEYFKMLDKYSFNYLDKMMVPLIKELPLMEENQSYKNRLFDSFNNIFYKKDEKEVLIGKEWFFKMPRCSDACYSGNLDMAYHAWLQGSDMIQSIIKKYSDDFLNE